MSKPLIGKDNAKRAFCASVKVEMLSWKGMKGWTVESSYTADARITRNTLVISENGDTKNFSRKSGRLLVSNPSDRIKFRISPDSLKATENLIGHK